MFPIVSVLAALPWRLIAAVALAAGLFVGGCQYGEKRVTARWGTEKAATAQAVARQAERVAAITNRQSDINQEISNEFQKTAAAIAADRPRLPARVPRRVRDDTSDGAGAVPEVPVAAAGTDAVPANTVPPTGGSEAIGNCGKLAEDAAQTTLMVVEFQRWYREQATAFDASSRRGL
jgi:hypothetical protein